MKNFLQSLFKPQVIQRTEVSGRAYPAGSLTGVTFDGEQDLGAMGSAYVYDVDYYEMAERAYTLASINEFAVAAIQRLTQFAVGTGLKLHPEPAKRFLKKKCKIDISDDFVADVQDLWNLFEDDKNLSSDKLNNIHGLANIIFYNAFVAGDVLVIKRVKNGNLEYQVINGLSVKSTKTKGANNNKITDGVEVDETGKHIAYYVIDENAKETRIPARDSKGRLVAWLIYADKRRLGAVRGYSPLGAIMQKLHKINQYTNAEIIAADTNAKFAATIEQDDKSSGVNPLKGLPGVSRSLKATLETAAPAQGATAQEVASFKERLKRISSGLFIHMPKGQKLNSFDTKRPNVNYGQFVDSAMKYSYASLGVPYEVVLLVFSNNFSASRASLKMFEMILKYLRKHVIVDGFYQEVYKQFFEIECLKGNINAPKYLALKNDEGYLDNAYTHAKFIGAQIPHIDETKEVNAVLSKLKGGLTTFEQALESLGNMTDFDSLIDKRKAEQEKIKESGLDFETILTPEITISQDKGE